MDRRTALGFLAGGLSWPLLAPVRAGPSEPSVYLSARVDDEGAFRVSGFTAEGRRVLDLALPERGHAFAVHATHRAVVHFARRPGRFAKVIDLGSGRAVADLTPPDDRHFYGHGVFSRAGLLYATENDFDGERGVIGVYDAAAGYRRVGELSSHGVGPHEIRLMPDGETLVVANGGILTHPDLPRIKLNLPSMSPSLVYIDRRDGRLLERVRLDPALHQLSIRHIDVGRNATVAVAMQYQGPAGDLVPLVATHRGNGPLRILKAPDAVLRAMNHYCGSVAFDRGGRLLGVSAPRGNVVTFWDAVTGKLTASAPVPDGCGLAAGTRSGTFVVSSGQGGVVMIDARSGESRPITSAFLDRGRWDNHIAVTPR